MPISLKEVHSLPSLQRTYKWDLSFPVIPSKLTKYVGISGTNFSKRVNIRAISTSVPVARFDKVSVAPRGIDIDEPGLVHLNGEIQFQLVDTVDLFTRKMLYSLRQICMEDINKAQSDLISWSTETGRTGQSLTMRMDRLDINNKANWSYLVYKAFLSGYDDPAFGGESSAVTPSLTISYNYFIDGNPTNINNILSPPKKDDKNKKTSTK